MSTGLCMPILTPYRATVAPRKPLSAGDCYNKAKTGVRLGAAPLFSMTELIDKFKKMLKPWGGQGKYPFSLECNSGGHHTTTGK